MTKAKTKGQKRRARKQVGKRALQDRWSTFASASPRPQEDPRRVVLSARCRHLGRPDNASNRRAMTWEGLGDPVGQAIHVGARDAAERDDLWGLFKCLDSAHEVYSRRIIGQARHPRCAKIEFLTERFETRPDDKPDLRTDAERDADARADWSRWCRLMSSCNIGHRIALHDALWLRCEFVSGGRLTAAGRDMISALRELRSLVV